MVQSLDGSGGGADPRHERKAAARLAQLKKLNAFMLPPSSKVPITAEFNLYKA